MKKLTLPVILFCLLSSGAVGMVRGRAQNAVLQPTRSQLPAWLEQGKIHFARFDGGPIEVQKAMRSSWGEQFTPQETEVLGNLYGKYGDRMVALLTQAHVNFVWVTYSVGFSWQDEAAQRAAVREIVHKLHNHGIHVAAYMCPVSVFWQSMFKDVPQSVRWIMFDPQDLPYRYSGGRDPLRFIADLRNPEWIDYQEKRVSTIVDDGLDAIFFDNTASPKWASNQTVANFFTQIRQFIHDRKHSGIPLFSNFGLSPSRAALNRYMNFTYDENWREPGLWGADWDVSNIRRDRSLHGMLPSWKPVITEYSIFHGGDRSTSFLEARSQKLGIAEAAALGTAYTWDMEGPLDASLIARDPRAIDAWSAISHYNGFVEDHSSLYVGATNVTPLLVLIRDNYKPGFDRSDSPTSSFFDLLSRHSVLYSVKPADQITGRELDSYSGVVIPFFPDITPGQKQLIHNYQARGGKIYAFAKGSNLDGLKAAVSSPEVLEKLASDPSARRELQSKLAPLVAGGAHVKIKAKDHVLANLTSLGGGKEVVLHLLNYDSKPVHGLRVKLYLGQAFKRLAGHRPVLISPDSGSASLQDARWTGTTLEVTLPSLDVYSLVVLR